MSTPLRWHYGFAARAVCSVGRRARWLTPVPVRVTCRACLAYLRHEERRAEHRAAG